MINKFIPVNPSEAKGTVKVPFEYPSEDYDDTNSANPKNKYLVNHLHGERHFLGTSPVT